MNKDLVLLVFSTNKAHALDLYLIFARRIHFEQTVEQFVNYPNFTSGCSDLRTCTLSKMLSAFTINASLQPAGQARTWVT
jgi:hypothetical protein